MKRLLTVIAFAVFFAAAFAQRPTDKLSRGLVAVPLAANSSIGNFVSWRILADEYYGVKYNLYRNGVKLNATPLAVSNYTDSKGSSTSTYQVAPVVNGVEKEKSSPVGLWNCYIYKLGDHRTVGGYFDIVLQPVYDRNGKDVSSHYFPNDAEMADLDGDGELEIIIKRLNEWDAGNTSFCSDANSKDIYSVSNTTEFSTIEAYKLDGTRLWWIDVGPNMVSLNSTELNVIAYDWDQDGKAEVVLRGADDMIIHMADGTTRTVGVAGKSYRSDINSHTDQQYAWTHTGPEYLLYLNGETAQPYTIMTYPLARLEAGENEYNAWVYGQTKSAYGHRSSKYFFGAPFLDGRKASLFLARGIYTREKMIAYDIDPKTHLLTQKWKWECKTEGSPWFGNGYHNFCIADVDWDGRDEIVYGSMVIDDNGKGLSTTGLGHGDALHCGDLDPYRHGQEIFACNEDKPSMNFRNATTSELYYRHVGTNDDGRALCANFSNNYPGSMGRSVDTGIIGCASDKIISEINADNFLPWGNLNSRIYWDGDLCSEYLDSPGTAKEAKIEKPDFGRFFTTSGCNMNNSSKNNPCFQGDIIGDWREEIVLRCGHNLRIYTSTVASNFGFYSLWYDMQYRQAMVWQMMGYNQSPHPSFFLGQIEGFTVAPPPLTMTGRTEINNGGGISAEHNGKHVIMCNAGDMSANIEQGATPSVITDNAPTWVQGHDDNNNITTTYYTHSLNGTITGNTQLTKQGDGTLVLEANEHTYSGGTNIWGGTLKFDGTLTKSAVKLNRHSTLITDGGSFDAGITVDYGATLNIGGETNKASVNVSNLILNYGARIVADIFSDEMEADVLNATKMTINRKVGDNWTNYGPKYLAPVLQIVQNNTQGADKPADGKYLIANIGSISGSINNLIVEGLDGVDYSLQYEDGKLYLLIGNPEIYIQTADTPNDGEQVGTQNVEMTYGTGFNGVDNDGMGYKCISSTVPNVEPAENNLIPTKGCFYKFVTLTTGILNVMVEMQAGANAYVMEDNLLIATLENNAETARNKNVQIMAREGYTYYLYSPDNTMPFYRFSFSENEEVNNSYAVAEGEKINVRQHIRSVEFINMTYGGFASSENDRTANVNLMASSDNYTVNNGSVADSWADGTTLANSFSAFPCMTSGTGQDARNDNLAKFDAGDFASLPNHGTYYKFEPKRNGTLTVYFLLNANKNVYMADEDANVVIPSSTQTAAAGVNMTKNDDGSYSFGAKAVGKFAFSVRGGKTYFLFGAGTKLGFCGFSFSQSSTSTKEVTLLPDEDFNTSTKAIRANVTLKRTFVANRWNSLILPFSMTEAQVQQAFGEGSVIALFDRIENGKLHFKRHYYQNIVANQPCLIYVTYGRDHTNDKIDETLSGVPVSDDIVINGVCLDGNAVPNNNFTANWGDAQYTFTGVYDNTTNIPVGGYYISSSVFYYNYALMKCGPFKAFIKATGDQGSNKLSVAIDEMPDLVTDGIMPLVEDRITTGDDTDSPVYSIAGQKVSNRYSALPKGIYIKNGKKVIVK